MAEGNVYKKVSREAARKLADNGEIRNTGVRGGTNYQGTYHIEKQDEIILVPHTFNGETSEYPAVMTDRGVIETRNFFRNTCEASEANGTNVYLSNVFEKLLDGCNDSLDLAFKLAEGGTLVVGGSKIPYYSAFQGRERLPEGRVRKIGMCCSSASWTPATPAAAPATNGKQA